MHNERLCAYCHAKPYKAVWSMSKGGGAPLKPSKSRGNKLGLQAVVIERLFLWIYHCEQWSKKLILAKLPHLMLLSLSMLRRWRRTRFHQAKVRRRLSLYHMLLSAPLKNLAYFLWTKSNEYSSIFQFFIT